MSLQVFDFKENPVRVAESNGKPVFITIDVCRVLGLANSRDAVASLDDDEKGVATTDTLGGKQEMGFVTESGLYSLIFKSRKPQAKAFQKWVTSEVLPAIRQNGFYLQSSLDFDRYPVARDFADIYGWLRSMDIGSDVAANTARSLVWKGKKRAAATRIKPANRILEVLSPEWEPTATLCEVFNGSQSTFYRLLSAAKKAGLAETKLANARLVQ